MTCEGKKSRGLESQVEHILSVSPAWFEARNSAISVGELTCILMPPLELMTMLS